MTSDLQWIANRLNAQRSTGPRTTLGRKTSAQNAVTHGLSQPVSTVDSTVTAIEKELGAELPGELAARVAWQIIELERVEQHLQRSINQQPQTQTSLVDGLTGIPLTPEILQGLLHHFSPSELEGLLSRAIPIESKGSGESITTLLRRSFRYLRRASNRLTQTIEKC